MWYALCSASLRFWVMCDQPFSSWLSAGIKVVQTILEGRRALCLIWRKCLTERRLQLQTEL